MASSYGCPSHIYVSGPLLHSEVWGQGSQVPGRDCYKSWFLWPEERKGRTKDHGVGILCEGAIYTHVCVRIEREQGSGPGCRGVCMCDALGWGTNSVIDSGLGMGLSTYGDGRMAAHHERLSPST